MKTTISIREKLTVYFLMIGLITAAIIGVVSYTNSREALLKRTFDQLTSVRIEKKKRIEIYFSDRIRDIKQIARSEDIKKIAGVFNNISMPENEKTGRIEEIFDLYLNKYLLAGKYFNNLVLYNEKGEAVRFFPGRESGRVEIQIEITGQPPGSSWESAFEQNKTIIEDFKHATTSGGIYFRITTPLHDNSNLVAGLISLEISVEAINDIMYENNPHNGLGRSGESYLVGSDYLMRSTSRFQDNSVFKTKVKTAGVQEAFNNITANSIIKDYRNIDVLSSYSKVIIPGLDWVILAEIDLKEAMIPIIEIRNRILFLFILIAILIFGFSYFFSSRFTKPVIKLKEEAVRIGKGEKGSPLEKKSNDEIGQLTDSFNLMAEKIHEQKEFLRIERMRSLQALIDGQDNERQRLSRELHDGLGQLLIALKLKYESLFDDQEQNPGAVELSLLFDKTIEETRRISNNLMPAVLVEFGLDTALKTLCDDVKRNSGLEVSYSSSIKNDFLPDEYKVPVYRIVQESLNNTVKHAKAKKVSVIFNMLEKSFSLEITDDGIGFDVQPAGKNLNARGLKNIEERVELMDGDLTISSQADMGTRIIIRISTNRNNE